MPRSSLTLAATVSAALPRTCVVGVRTLTEDSGGRFDTVLATLDDGHHVVGRIANDADASAELAANVRALGALTAGVRALLPFRAPQVLGETVLDGERFVVTDYVPGYRVDAADVPKGAGVATRLGAAIAAVHALPTSVARAEGLPARTSDQLRDDAARLLDRVDATRRAPGELVARWRRAVAADALWRFEATVVLGGAVIDAFVFEDDDVAGPTVAALLDWHGLSVGDPAIDLRWTSSAPVAADAALDGYGAASDRAPDAGLRQRARLHAELEFAQWLVHGFDTGRSDVVDDAAALLTSLADGVRGEDILVAGSSDIDDALALLDRTPSPPDAAAIDTSMQTDAYDPRILAAYLAEEDAARDGTGGSDPDATGALDLDPNATAPIDLGPAPLPADDTDPAEVHRDAERAALQRWARSDSE